MLPKLLEEPDRWHPVTCVEADLLQDFSASYRPSPESHQNSLSFVKELWWKGREWNITVELLQAPQRVSALKKGTWGCWRQHPVVGSFWSWASLGNRQSFLLVLR